MVAVALFAITMVALALFYYHNGCLSLTFLTYITMVAVVVWVYVQLEPARKHFLLSQWFP